MIGAEDDVGDDLSGPFEKEQRIYAIRNKAFVETFEAPNRDRRWDTKGLIEIRPLTYPQVMSCAVAIIRL